MLRLRTSSGLSLLALAVGIAGTAWLSTLTAAWQGPAARVAAMPEGSTSRHARPSPHRRHGAISAVHARHAVLDRPGGDAASQAAVLPPAPLLPLAMPSDTSQRWDELRGHLDGRVVLHVDIDGRGHVMPPASVNPAATRSSTNTPCAVCAAGASRCRSIIPMESAARCRCVSLHAATGWHGYRDGCCAMGLAGFFTTYQRMPLAPTPNAVISRVMISFGDSATSGKSPTGW